MLRAVHGELDEPSVVFLENFRKCQFALTKLCESALRKLIISFTKFGQVGSDLL